MIDSKTSVSDVVLEHSECAEVFQRYRIDFCCRGGLSIEAAALAKRVDKDVVVAELEQAIASRGNASELDPRSLSTKDLVAYIVTKHHDYLRRVLPFVGALAAKVNRVHHTRNPKLSELDSAVGNLVNSLLPHIDSEERALFPTLTATKVDRVHAASELASMQEEHLRVAAVLERVRLASDDFTLPEWACTSYRTLFSELQAIESDVFRHVHLENHVLGPRFALE